MNKELQALLDKVNKERDVNLGINTNCDGCKDGEFEIVDIYYADKSGLAEDFIVIYHGTSIDEAIAEVIKYTDNAEHTSLIGKEADTESLNGFKDMNEYFHWLSANSMALHSKETPQMIDIKCTIPYDEENNYLLRVKEQDKELATELVNKAYNEFLKNDHCDFQEDASKLLRAKGVEFEFSIWEKE